MRFQTAVLATIAAALLSAEAAAQQPDPASIEFKTYRAPVCLRPEGNLGLKPQDAGKWTACEQWVWSCIRQGKEANLYIKECTNPRPGNSEPNWRKPFQYAPFFEPERYQHTNALSDGFLRSILADPFYATQVEPPGVRIFGGYFANHVNFENVKTTANLVLDGSIFKQGLRFTNFESSKNISLDGSNVRGSILLMRARIEGSLFLQNGVYDTVDTRDTRIGSSLDAPSSVFNDELRIDRARIDGKINLAKARLTVFNAWSAVIGGYVEMRLAALHVQRRRNCRPRKGSKYVRKLV